MQFGVTKCKSILVIKDRDSVFNSDIMVDNLEAKYEENPMTGNLSLNENFSGQTKIEQIDKQMYLGFVISPTGDNLVNIEHIKKKSIGIIRKIFID